MFINSWEFLHHSRVIYWRYGTNIQYLISLQKYLNLFLPENIKICILLLRLELLQSDLQETWIPDPEFELETCNFHRKSEWKSMAEMVQILTSKSYSTNISSRYLDWFLCKHSHFNCWKLTSNCFSFKSWLGKINFLRILTSQLPYVLMWLGLVNRYQNLLTMFQYENIEMHLLVVWALL